jgi:aerobic-type carbon monoxide dehydrogenase small subunit (CoxS/CutS family)
MTAKHAIHMTVNGKRVEGLIEPRLSLADFLREHLGLISAVSKEFAGAARSCSTTKPFGRASFLPYKQTGEQS